MTTNFSRVIDSFQNLLSEHKNIIGKQEYLNYLISFKLPGNDFQLDNKLSVLLENYNRVFHFENVNENFSLTGIGRALDLSENGLGRFSSIGKSLQELKNKVVTNWEDNAKEFPLICGGMKFTVEHSEDEWEDFKDSDWFVPEFLFVKKHGSLNLFYNFINHNSSLKKLTDKFSKQIEALFYLPSEYKSKTSKVLSITGISPKDKKKWKTLVSNTLNRLADNEISKIVLSRRVDMALPAEPNWDEIRRYFTANYASCLMFFYHNNTSTFFGASPERLIKFHDRNVTIDVLAGSITRGKDDDEDKVLENVMLTSSKLNREHEFVVHQIKKAISKFVTKIISNKIPIKKLQNIQHLHTILQSELLAETNMFEIIEAIYPTGAICGEPKDKALSLLKKLEEHRRGFYSGIIGHFNVYDEGEFVVAIRSAIFNKNKLYAYAGCGLVEGSDPDKEYDETELKLRAILAFFDEKNKSK